MSIHRSRRHASLLPDVRQKLIACYGPALARNKVLQQIALEHG